MNLIEITKENWVKVVLLTTNENGSHTLGEEFVASNAYSLVQSAFEPGWTTKAIEQDGTLIGFAMYGWCEERSCYELCRFMLDRKAQGQGYGKQALSLIVQEMKQQFGCEKIYLSIDPENHRGKHVYEQFGFVPTGDVWDDEEVFCLPL
ncbi:GNAT family N-acetyltransferase [Gorillibacterium sp. CAU 1737]|uniref:GNAT family N-acetyltransferase n=1 Tax=Gorillibacterium sp. CAU 1737 TaxID=3140362 RepID=UPI003260B152